MEREELYQAIFRRRSVRKYEQAPLGEDVMDMVRGQVSSLRPMVPGIGTELKILTANETKGAIRVPAPHYLAVFSEEKEGFDANAGFMLQQMDLFLSANGIGSCWQGGAKPAKGVGGVSGMDHVIMLAFGRPAEAVHRQSVADFDRKPLPEISSVRGSDEIMEAARLAPSGINKQPWFFTGVDGTVNVYADSSIMFNRLNRISAGIALCHLWLAAGHAGRVGEIVMDEAGRSDAPRGRSYIASLSIR